jgi:hypothetical protein
MTQSTHPPRGAMTEGEPPPPTPIHTPSDASGQIPEARFRCGAVDASRQRQERVRRAMEQATMATMRGDLVCLLRLCREALDDLEGAWPTFARDELALSDAIGTLAVAAAWCRSHRKTPPDGLRELLERATGLRMRWLDGDE